MRDTAPEAEAAFTALFAGRSEVDRLKMTCRMFDDARALVEAGIRSQCPGISAVELRALVFERLYHGDFDARPKARLLSVIRSGARSASQEAGPT
jgi:hypothetical protein